MAARPAGPCAPHRELLDPAPIVSVSCGRAFDRLSLTTSLQSGMFSAPHGRQWIWSEIWVLSFTSLSLSFSSCELGVRVVHSEKFVVRFEGDNTWSRHLRILLSSCCVVSSSIPGSIACIPDTLGPTSIPLPAGFPQ